MYMLGKNEAEKGAGVLEALGRPYGRGSRAVPGKIAWQKRDLSNRKIGWGSLRWWMNPAFLCFLMQL